MSKTTLKNVVIKANEALGSKETVASEQKADAPEVEFNEQTNYVPVKTIITVRQHILSGTSYFSTADVDFHRLRKCRPPRAHGSNNARSQPYNHFQGSKSQYRERMDFGRLLPHFDCFPAALWPPIGHLVAQSAARDWHWHLLHRVSRILAS